MSEPSEQVESFDCDEEELFLVGPDGEEEGLEICVSTDFSWFTEAEQDLVAALEVIQREHPSEEDDEETDINFASVDVETDCDFNPENRTASYGESWEEDPLSEWMPEKILKRHARKGICSYLIKWKSHNRPTWELEEDLFEEGHSGIITTFNRERLDAMEKSNKQQQKKKEVKKAQPPLHRLLKYILFDPRVYWKDFKQRIESRFALSGMQAITIYNVCNSELAATFSNHWKTSTPDSIPVMVFHGTALNNIKNIVTGGLRIPNTGTNPVQVANGSVHGIGIYSSVNPSVCVSYSRNSGYIIVCAGLTSGHFASSVKTPGDYVVFFDDRLLLPCFLVAFERTIVSSAPATYKQNIDQETLTSYAQISTTPSGTYVNYTVAMLVARYRKGLMTASTQVKCPTSIRSGAKEGIHKYEKGKRTLTKKELRSAPKSAKQAYKAGLLLQSRK